MVNKALLCFTVGLALAGSGRATAEMRWSESRAVVDEVVTDTETPVPTGTLTPLLTRTSFDNLRYPHVDACQNVTFIADDTFFGSKGINHGIYRSPASGALICLVRGGETTVPGSTATLQGIRGLQMDENGENFIFNAFDSREGRGLYHWSRGKLDTIARVGETVLPGEDAPLTDIEYGALHGTHVLYQATTRQHSVVLVLHDLATGGDRVLCHAGLPMPGRAGASFQYIGHQNWLTGDSIVFRAASVKDPYDALHKGAMGVYGWFGIKDWSAGSADLAFERMRTVVDASTPVPIADAPAGATFDQVTSTPIAGGLMAFQGNGEGFDGIFYTDKPGGPIRCIADDKTEMEGLFKGHFTHFGVWPTVIGRNIVFTAYAAAGQTGGRGFAGVFLYRVDRDELFVLADNRSQIDGKDVRYFEIAGHFLSNNRFAVTAKFTERTSQGVYLATIPPRAFKRMNSDAVTAAMER